MRAGIVQFSVFRIEFLILWRNLESYVDPVFRDTAVIVCADKSRQFLDIDILHIFSDDYGEDQILIMNGRSCRNNRITVILYVLNIIASADLKNA